MLDNKKVYILHENTLTGLGLKSLLIEYFSPEQVESEASISVNFPDDRLHFDLYMVSSEYFTLFHDFFFTRKNKTIVLLPGGYTNGSSTLNTLDIQLSYGDMIDRICKILSGIEPDLHKESTQEELSARELEVLIYIVQGFTNKQIAEKMSISQHTVMSHRKNTMNKLGIKTVSGLTVYAIMNGYISADYSE